MRLKNLDQLTVLIDKRLQLAFRFTQQEVFTVIQKHIEAYYAEKVFWHEELGAYTNKPNIYQRTEQFLHSLFKTDIVNNRGKISCSVYINTDNMSYIHTGREVVNMINRGYHADRKMNMSGYTPKQSIAAEGNFWDDAIKELGGYEGILDLMKQNMKKVGIPIK